MENWGCEVYISSVVVVERNCVVSQMWLEAAGRGAGNTMWIHYFAEMKMGKRNYRLVIMRRFPFGHDFTASYFRLCDPGTERAVSEPLAENRPRELRLRLFPFKNL